MAADEPVEVSATFAGHDGTIIAVTPHRDAHATDPPAGQEAITICVAGEVDLDTSPLLHTVLIDAVNTSARVSCDLSGVVFFSAAGANTLLAAHLHAATVGHRLTVAGVHGITRRILEITGMDQVLTVTT